MGSLGPQLHLLKHRHSEKDGKTQVIWDKVVYTTTKSNLNISARAEIHHHLHSLHHSPMGSQPSSDQFERQCPCKQLTCFIYLMFRQNTIIVISFTQLPSIMEGITTLHGIQSWFLKNTFLVLNCRTPYISDCCWMMEICVAIDQFLGPNRVQSPRWDRERTHVESYAKESILQDSRTRHWNYNNETSFFKREKALQIQSWICEWWPQLL